METILANLAGKVRREKLWGRDFFVAPMTMIVPGVLNGSQGPLYYPEEAVVVNYTNWNHLPVVVPDHPKDKNGKPVSARSPEIIDKYGVGFVFNSTGDKKLGAEAWFDVELIKTRSIETHDRLANNQSIELSTGLIPKVEIKTGDHNGTAYVGIVNSIEPDHLAVLPHGEGACSRKHGCGVLVNEDRSLLQKLVDLITNKTVKETTTVAKLTDVQKTKIVDDLITNCGCSGEKVFTPEDKTYLTGLPEDRLVALNASREKRAATDALLTKFSKGVEHNGSTIIINEAGTVEVKTKEPVVHEIGGKKYTMNERTGNLEPVKADGTTTNEKPVEKPADKKPLTDAEFLATLPPGSRVAFESFMAVNQQQKNQHIAVILQNAANEYKPEELATMDPTQLKKLAALAGNGYETEGSYSAPLFMGAGTMTLNADEQGDFLELPVMDFATDEK